MNTTNKITNFGGSAQIKCTFVRLYDKDGMPCFSLNANNKEIYNMTIGKTNTYVDGSTNKLHELTLSNETIPILRTYLNTYVKNNKGLKPEAKRLAAHFATKVVGKNTLYADCTDPVFYVKPIACKWKLEFTTGDKTTTEEPETVLSGKTKLAIAAAALLALFNN